MQWAIGRMFASISIMSVAVVLIVPVILSSAIHCMLSSFFAVPAKPQYALPIDPMYVGRNQMLTMYSILGMATVRYNWCVRVSEIHTCECFR